MLAAAFLLFSYVSIFFFKDKNDSFPLPLNLKMNNEFKETRQDERYR